MFKDCIEERAALANTIEDLIANTLIEDEIIEELFDSYSEQGFSKVRAAAAKYKLLGKIEGIVTVCDLFGINVKGLDALKELYLED